MGVVLDIVVLNASEKLSDYVSLARRNFPFYVLFKEMYTLYLHH